MVGVKARRLVLPGNVVLNDVPDAGLAAAHLEAVAVSGRRHSRSAVAEAVHDRPAVLDQDRNLLRDQVIAVVGVDPRPAAADDGAGPGHLVVNAEAISVLAVALAAVLVVVVVRVAVQDQITAGPV